jgi:hypothetical protein
MKITNCLNCGSEKILLNIPLRAAGGKNYIYMYEKPDALLFKRPHFAEIQGALCVECGFLHPFVSGDLDPIRAVYEKHVESVPGEAGEGHGIQGIMGLLDMLAHSPDMIERQHALAGLEELGWTPNNDRERMLSRLAQEPIECVWFGTPTPQQGRMCNPEFNDVTVPLYFLRQIIIDTETYDADCVERFLTYVVNTLGQNDLKHHVTVQITGDPEHLHRTLRNSLTNLCKHVSLQQENEKEE